MAGAVLRAAAPAGSTLYDIGTLLLVLWVPAVGNIIGWLMRRRAARRARAAAPPPAWGPFAPHLRAGLQWVAAPPAPGELPCLLVVGAQGFTARARVPGQGGDGVVEIEFRAPQAALPHFPPASTFNLVQGQAVTARGTVLHAEIIAPAPT